MNLAALSDNQLLSHFIKTNDEKAFAELYRRNRDTVCDWIKKNYWRNDLVAEYLVAETFADVRANCREYNPAKSFAAWLLKLAGNVAINYKGTIPMPQPNLSEVTRLLSGLAEQEQQAITFVLIDNMAERDAAKAIGVPQQQCRRILNSALRKLKSEYRVSA